MEAGKTIRLVAVFVVGVVLAMGGAMIYSVAKQMRQPAVPATQAAAASPEARATSTSTAAAGPTMSAVQQAETSESSVVRVPVPPPDEPSEAYVQLPQKTVVQAPPVSEPATAASASKPVFASRGAVSNSQPSLPAVRLPVTTQPLTIQPWTAAHTPSTTAQTSQPNTVPTPSAVQPHAVTLWSGTPLTVKLAEPLSTDQSKEGQYFRATLAVPVVEDGFVIADAGSGVTGEVVESRHTGLFGRAPDLRLTLVQIRTTDNQVVRVETISWDDRGRGHNPVTGTLRSAVGAVGALTGAVHGNGVFAPQNAEASATKGHNVLLPANTVLEFRLAAPVSLTEHTH